MLSVHLKSRHQEKIREQAIKQSALLRERQDIFKEAFEEEMKNYVSSGHLERKLYFIKYINHIFNSGSTGSLRLVY